MSHLTDNDVERLLALPRPDTQAMIDLPQSERAEIDNRVAALVALIQGEPVRRVATLHGLDPRTCKRMLVAANQPAPAGGVLGFAVCIPRLRLVEPRPRNVHAPLLKRSYDMSRLVESIPDFKAVLAKFKGALPTRTQRSPAFDRLFREVNLILKRHGRGEDDYPRNTFDGGRRALIKFITRARARAADVAMTLVSPAGLTRWAELYKPEPFDEAQLDGHFIDLKDQWCSIPGPDGTFQLARVSGLILLAEIDIGSRACMGWKVIVDKAYSQFDFIATIKRALLPWHPKDMTGRRMQYLPNAWMPGAIEGPPPRALRISVDNYSSHLATLSRQALRHARLGVYRFGNAGIPETRGHIEAFFKAIEVHVLRYLAGGYEPETRARDEQRVSTKNSKTHPIFLDLVEDLLDIVFSSYNVTPHPELNNSSPREEIERYLAEGGMPLRSSRTVDDVRDLGRVRVRVTVRGAHGELPHVTHGYGTYRSDKLSTRPDLIGKTFNAYVEEDARFLVLLDDSGRPYLELKTLPPYSLTAHTLDARKRAHRWRKARGERWADVHDVIAAYHAEVLDIARRLPWAADAVTTRRENRDTPSPPPPHGVAARTLEGFAPRGGPVSLRRR